MKLEDLLQVLSSEEKANFHSYLTKGKKRADVKNKDLFVLLDKGVSPKEIPMKLYGKDNKRAYHALRIRLQSNLIDFLGQEGLQTEAQEEVGIYKLVFLGRKFLQRQYYDIGIEFLLSAKEKASQVQHYVLLNEIFHSLVQYSYVSPKIDVQEIIKGHAENARLFIQEERLNIVFALVQGKLKEHLYNRESAIPNDLVEELIREYKIELSSFSTFKALFQYIKIPLAIAQAKNDYYGYIEKVVLQYEQVKVLQEDNSRQLFYHVRLLYSISNTYFRIKEFATCSEYIKKLEQLIFQAGFAYKERFRYKFIILASLNANYSGKNQEAIDMVEAINLKKVSNFRDKNDLSVCLILYFFHQENYKEAKQVFLSLFHTDRYYEDRMGVDWLMKLKLIEIILFFELDEMDLIESRLRSFKRSFFKYLKVQNQDRVIQFVQIIELLYKDPDRNSTSLIENKLEQLVGQEPLKKDDIFVQSYFGWIKAKLTNRDVYEVTLELAE